MFGEPLAQSGIARALARLFLTGALAGETRSSKSRGGGRE
jgi:hypothetical protein